MAQKPYIVITEQPQSKALRFRYECEGRSAGSIPGVSSTAEQKTFPTIEIRGYTGRVVVVVSCVTKDPPYRPHPHNLVGKEGCKKGVCTVEINNSSMSYTFSNLGIQCVKKKDIKDALQLREEIRVDPFKTGYGHGKQPASIDLNAVRLCFQAFLEGQQRGHFTNPLVPVVSDIIYDKKAMSELVICKLSHVAATMAGGKEVILLCEKVVKEDIAVRFYEEQQGKIVWEDHGEFPHSNVHKQVAISFRTPRYRSLDVEHSVMVHIQLKRPSDGATSEPVPFELIPVDGDNYCKKRKRSQFNSSEITDARREYAAAQIKPPGPSVKIEPKDSHLQQSFVTQSTYRNPADSPENVMTPMTPASPFEGAVGYQTGNEYYAVNQRYQSNYNNFSAAGPSNGLPLYQQHQYQQMGVHYGAMNNLGGALANVPATGQQGFNLHQPHPQQQQQMTDNLDCLLDMELAKGFPINSSEIKTMMGQFGEPYRVQQEEENLSNSFTRLTTSTINNANK
ncbi:embryonic polarity protein dorsal-like [Aedes albopictus]|uniref:RHD domain-containing protein n=1 Tax=Aedes albopictus TaxID=7160 RepID=A0ABM1ZWU9_AEDAL|nr:embryonic polarity protein dorsal-like [Aedes albopictus]